MKIAQILPVVLNVLKSPYIIGTSIVIILYCNFVSYVSKYKKKPPKPKKKKVEAAPAPAPKAEGEDGAGEETPEEAEE